MMMSGITLEDVLSNPIPSIVATVLAAVMIIVAVGRPPTGLSLDRIFACTLALFLAAGALLLSASPAVRHDTALPWLPTALVLITALVVGLLAQLVRYRLDERRYARAIANLRRELSDPAAADDGTV